MSKTVTDDFFDYSIDYRHRIIYLGNTAKNEEDNEVDAHMAEQVIKGLLCLDIASERPITIIINTPGGCVTQGMAIYDAIRSCTNHVTGVVYGEASSMGSVILQACDHRLLSPHSVVMIHNGSISLDQKVEDAERAIDLDRKYRKMMEDIYLRKIKERHPRFTRKKLKEMLAIDTYFLAKDAAQLGLADKVMTDVDG